MTLQGPGLFIRAWWSEPQELAGYGVHVCYSGTSAWTGLEQEVGEFQANLGYIADPVSKIAKQKNGCLR